MKITTLLLLTSFFLIVSCDSQKKDQKQVDKTENQAKADSVQIKNEFVQSAEDAHHYTDFLAEENVQFDLQLFFGGNERLNATITMATNSSKIVIDKKDGTKMVYTGKEAFITPDSSMYKGARFDMFTWTYFFALPYKLSDPGTQWSTFNGVSNIDSIQFTTKKLSFDSNIGDSPDDWYVLYSNPETNLITYAAYIVTLSKSLEKAEEDPHAIQYSNFKEVDGIPIAHTWTFWGWKSDLGITDKLGTAEISNVKFLEVDDSFYSAPANATEIE